MAEGLLDMTHFFSAYYAGDYPLIDFSGVPGFTDTVAEMSAVVNDPRIVTVLEDLFQDIGVQYLGAPLSSPNTGIWMAKVKLDAVDKFEGCKIRTSGANQKAAAEALGAASVVATMAELETMIMRGTVDGIVTAELFGWMHGFTDICDYVSFWPINSGMCCYLGMNAEKFDAMPADLQKIMKDTCAEVVLREHYAINSQIGFAMQGIGMTDIELVYPSAAEKAKALEFWKPIMDDWIKTCGPQGAEVAKIIDEVVAKYRAYK